MKKILLAVLSGVFLFAGVLNAASKAAEKTPKAEPKAEKAAEPKVESGNEESGKPKKGERMELIKFDKGEVSGEPEATLSKEKPEKGKMYCMKLTFKKDQGISSWVLTGSSGILKGKRGNWSNYDTLNVKYINMLGAPIKMGIMIGDQKSMDAWDENNFVSKAIVLQTGENVLSIDLSGLVCNNDRQLDLSNVRNFGLTGGPKAEAETVIYIQSIYLEKE